MRTKVDITIGKALFAPELANTSIRTLSPDFLLAIQIASSVRGIDRRTIEKEMNNIDAMRDATANQFAWNYYDEVCLALEQAGYDGNSDVSGVKIVDSVVCVAEDSSDYTNTDVRLEFEFPCEKSAMLFKLSVT